MNGARHYLAAERLLASSRRLDQDSITPEAVARAQVRATLAQTALSFELSMPAGPARQAALAAWAEALQADPGGQDGPN